MSTTLVVIDMPLKSTYGAVEIKDFIQRNTWRAFIITVSLFLLLLLLYFFASKLTEQRAMHAFSVPLSKIQLEAPPQENQNQDEAPPPPPTQQILDVATVARAGIPVPVPDADIKADLKEFANVEDINKSLSKNEGQIVNFDDLKNVNLDDANLNVKKEEEPSMEDFIPVEKEPNVDLGELQKKVVYPEMARRAGIEGQVIVRVLVDKNGKPKKVVVQASDSQMLDQSAKDAVMKVVFTPAIQNGQPITCWVSIPIRFRLR